MGAVQRTRFSHSNNIWCSLSVTSSLDFPSSSADLPRKCRAVAVPHESTLRPRFPYPFVQRARDFGLRVAMPIRAYYIPLSVRSHVHNVVQNNFFLTVRLARQFEFSRFFTGTFFSEFSRAHVDKS